MQGVKNYAFTLPDTFLCIVYKHGSMPNDGYVIWVRVSKLD